MLEDNESEEREERFLPRRPTGSALIALIAVAVAIFVLGGFIRTYRQLGALREDYKRKTAELETLKRQQNRSGAFIPRRQSAMNLPPLPPANRRVRPARLPTVETPSGETGAWSEVKSSLQAGDPLPGFDLEEQPVSRRPTVRFGRRSGEGEGDGASGGKLRVIAASDEKKLVLVEGGRDHGMKRGEAMELSRDGTYFAEVRVAKVYDNQSLCEVTLGKFAPQPDDMVRRRDNF